jgi:sugar lactone lactonase YvrE
MASKWKVAAPAAATVIVAGLLIASAVGSGKQASAPADATWMTVLASSLGIEGLTGDDEGNLYVAARVTGADCPVLRVASDGGANRAPITVGTIPAPCSPAGIAFGPDERLYVTGVGGDKIGVLRPDPAAPPAAEVFATGTPGANGIAFDGDGNLYASDGGTAQGRVFRVGSEGGEATELFRVPPMTNSVGVGRQNTAVPPQPPVGTPQNIVANGLAFTHDGSLVVADTARGALWLLDLARDGSVQSPTGCDTTFTPNTLCFDNVLVQHPFLDGADGIALDRTGQVWVDANERNAIAVVDRRGRVSEFFRNPVDGASLRNQGPLEFPTSPFLAGRTLCTTSSDGNRRDNFPSSGGEAAPGTAVVGKISCLEARLQVVGLPLPVR